MSPAPARKKAFPAPGNPAGFSRSGKWMEMRVSAHQITADRAPRQGEKPMQTQQKPRKEKRPRREAGTKRRSPRPHNQPSFSGSAGKRCAGGWAPPPARFREDGRRISPRKGNEAHSFGSLGNSRHGTRDATRPLDTFWPIHRKPEHGTLESHSSEVATIANLPKAFAAGKKHGGNARFGLAARCAVGLDSQKKLLA
jgi:hypothetical protein